MLIPLSKLPSRLSQLGVPATYAQLHSMARRGRIPLHQLNDGAWARKFAHEEDLPVIIEALLADRIAPEALPRVIAALMA